VDSSNSSSLSIDPSLLHLALSHSPVVVEICNPDGNIEYSNQTHQESSPSEPSQKAIFFSQSFLSRYPCLEEALERKETWSNRVLLSAPEGDLWESVHITPVLDHKKNIQNYLIIRRDISQEVEQNKERENQEKMLLIQNRQAQLGQLLSMVAHQWRQPLTIITSLISNIQIHQSLGELEGPFLEEKLEKISQTVKYLSRTIEDFRDFYQPSRGKELCPLDHLIDKTLSIIKDPLEKKSIKISRLWAEKRLPTLYLHTGEIMQVLMSLFQNAMEVLESNPREKREIRIAYESTLEHHRIFVENNGAPIDEEHLGNLFLPYFTTKEAKQGTGLGLFMAKTIMENHHLGDLLVKNTAQGVQFILQFPKEVRFE